MGREGSFTVNGPGWGEAATAPYRGFKGSLYSGGTLVPTFIRHGDVAAGGGIDRTFLTYMDVLPTLLEIAGQSVQGTNFQGREAHPVRGRSFWGLVTGRASTVLDASDTVPWMTSRRGALVRWPMKVVADSNPLDEHKQWELFDLEADPGERTDLSAEYPELAAERSELWLEYAREASSP